MGVVFIRPGLFVTVEISNDCELPDNNNLINKKKSKDTWIDTIFVDECDSIIRYDRFLPTFPSRHDIITVTIDVFHPSKNNETYYTYKCINKTTS